MNRSDLKKYIPTDEQIQRDELGQIQLYLFLHQLTNKHLKDVTVYFASDTSNPAFEKLENINSVLDIPSPPPIVVVEDRRWKDFLSLPHRSLSQNVLGFYSPAGNCVACSRSLFEDFINGKNDAEWVIAHEHGHARYYQNAEHAQKTDARRNHKREVVANAPSMTKELDADEAAVEVLGVERVLDAFTGFVDKKLDFLKNLHDEYGENICYDQAVNKANKQLARSLDGVDLPTEMRALYKNALICDELVGAHSTIRSMAQKFGRRELSKKLPTADYPHFSQRAIHLIQMNYDIPKEMMTNFILQEPDLERSAAPTLAQRIIAAQYKKQNGEQNNEAISR